VLTFQLHQGLIANDEHHTSRCQGWTDDMRWTDGWAPGVVWRAGQRVGSARPPGAAPHAAARRPQEPDTPAGLATRLAAVDALQRAASPLPGRGAVAKL